MADPIQFVPIPDRLAAITDTEIRYRRKGVPSKRIPRLKESYGPNVDLYDPDAPFGGENPLDASRLEEMVLADPTLAALFITDEEKEELTRRIELFVETWSYPILFESGISGPRGFRTISDSADYNVVFQTPEFIDEITRFSLGLGQSWSIYHFNTQWLATSGVKYETFADMVNDDAYREERSLFSRIVQSGELLRADMDPNYPGGQEAFLADLAQARVDIAEFLKVESIATDAYWAISNPEFQQELELISQDRSLNDSRGIDEQAWETIRNSQPPEAAQWFIDNKEQMELEFLANTNYDNDSAETWFFVEKAPILLEHLKRFEPLTSVEHDSIIAPYIAETIRGFDSVTAVAIANNLYSALKALAIQNPTVEDRLMLWTMLESGDSGVSLHSVLDNTLRNAVNTAEGGESWLEAIDARGLDLVWLWELSDKEDTSQKGMLDSIIEAGVAIGLPTIVLDPEAVNRRSFIIDMLNGRYDDLDGYSREAIISGIDAEIPFLTDDTGQVFQTLSTNNLTAFSVAFSNQISVTDLVDAVLKNNILSAGGEELLAQMEQGLGTFPEAFVNAYRTLDIDQNTKYATQWQFAIKNLTDALPKVSTDLQLTNMIDNSASNFGTASYQSIYNHAEELTTQMLRRYTDYDREDLFDGTIDADLAAAGEAPTGFAERVTMFVNQQFQNLIGDDTLAAGIIEEYGSANEFFAANMHLQEADSAEIREALENIPELTDLLQAEKTEEEIAEELRIADAGALRDFLSSFAGDLTLSQQAVLNQQASSLLESLTGGDAPMFESQDAVLTSTEFLDELTGFRDDILDREAGFTGAEQAVAQYVQGLDLLPEDVASALRSAQSAFSQLEATGMSTEDILGSAEFKASITEVTDAGDARRLRLEEDKIYNEERTLARADQLFAQNVQEVLDPAFRKYVERLMGSSVSDELINDLLPDLLRQFKASGQSGMTGGFGGVSAGTGDLSMGEVERDEFGNQTSESQESLDARSLALRRIEQQAELGDRFSAFASEQGLGLQRLLNRQKELRVGRVRTAAPTGGRQIRNPSLGVGL